MKSLAEGRIHCFIVLYDKESGFEVNLEKRQPALRLDRWRAVDPAALASGLLVASALADWVCINSNKPIKMSLPALYTVRTRGDIFKFEV
jgi:hypothetical protein